MQDQERLNPELEALGVDYEFVRDIRLFATGKKDITEYLDRRKIMHPTARETLITYVLNESNAIYNEKLAKEIADISNVEPKQT